MSLVKKMAWPAHRSKQGSIRCSSCFQICKPYRKGRHSVGAREWCWGDLNVCDDVIRLAEPLVLLQVFHHRDERLAGRVVVAQAACSRPPVLIVQAGTQLTSPKVKLQLAAAARAH